MDNKIGKFISCLRKEKGMTQSELGAKLFVTDKAVSKWERGISLPDISIIEELANVLDVSISELLSGKRGKTKKYTEEDISNIIKTLKRKQLIRLILLSLIFFIIFISLLFIIFKNIYLGFKYEKVEYINDNGAQDIIKLGIPKLSFSEQEKENSYSFKNLRGTKVLEQELKEYLKTLKYTNCNNSIYYYNEEENFTIVNYNVENHFFYNTISIQLYNDDYCSIQNVKAIQEKIYMNGFLSNNFDHLYGKEDYFQIWMVINSNNSEDLKFFTHLTAHYTKNGKSKILESSEGYVEVVNDKLIYTRTKIYTRHQSINIPNTSTFEILDNQKLKLNDDYLDSYERNIILRPETPEEIDLMIEASKNSKK